MQEWQIAACVALVYPALFALPIGLRQVRRVMARLGARPRGVRGPRRTVTGRIVCLRQVESPIDRLPCAIAWTVVEGKTRWGLPAVVELATAHEFLLESSEGTFLVRPADLWVVHSRIPAQFPLKTAAPAAFTDRLARARVAPSSPLLYGEGFFAGGDVIRLRGVCRDESSAELGGLREPRVLPTLSSGGGRLDILSPLGLVLPSL